MSKRLMLALLLPGLLLTPAALAAPAPAWDSPVPTPWLPPFSGCLPWSESIRRWDT